MAWYVARRDRIVVSTLRCGRSNLGSNPSHGSVFLIPVSDYIALWRFIHKKLSVKPKVT